MVREWVKKSIGELAEIQSGGTPSTNNANYWNGSIRWCTPSDITNNQGIYLSKTERNVTELGVENSSATMLPEGTILLCTRATIGEMAIAQLPMCTNQGFKNLIARKGTNNLFLYYALQMVKREMILRAYGSTFLELSKKSLETIEIIVPEKEEEQTQIASALFSLDELLYSLQKEIEKKNDIKIGILQEYLSGNKRLSQYKNSLWEKKKICELGNLVKNSINPQAFPDEIFWEYSMPAFDEGKLPKKVFGRNMNSMRFEISVPLLLFNKLNVRQKRVWVVETCKNNSVCSTEFLPFVSNKVNLQFLCELLLLDKVTYDFENMSTGTSNSQKRISPDSFLDYEVFIPKEKEEQEAIVDIIKDINKDIEILKCKMNKYTQLKQGMMSDLLTGKIRLV